MRKENKITAAMYEKAIADMMNIFPEDFEMIRYKDEMALATSETGCLNVLWIPNGCKHADAYICVGELNREDDTKEKDNEMNEVAGLDRLRSRRLDIDFD